MPLNDIELRLYAKLLAEHKAKTITEKDIIVLQYLYEKLRRKPSGGTGGGFEMAPRHSISAVVEQTERVLAAPTPAQPIGYPAYIVELDEEQFEELQQWAEAEVQRSARNAAHRQPPQRSGWER